METAYAVFSFLSLKNSVIEHPLVQLLLT